MPNSLSRTVIAFRVTVLCQVAGLVAILSMLAWPLPGGEKASSAFLLGATLAIVAALGLLLWMRGATAQILHREARDEARRLSDLQRDALTGALSRRFLLDVLRETLLTHRSGKATAGSQAAIILIDLDHFKKLNDGFGHNVGDYALTHLVETVRDVLPQASVGRLGGDEFAVVVDGLDGPACLAAADRILARLRQPAAAAGRHIHLSASMGIALAPQHSVFPEEMILLADLALYESKRNGRSRATLFDESLLHDERHRRFIERELRAAILLDHLELHYQPVVDAAGEVIGVEALARWPHPSLGYIAPGDFIPVAEATTLIDLMGEWVFRRCCRDFASLPGAVLSFNVSAAQLQRNDIVEMIRRVLAEERAEAAWFVMEITENLALGATPDVLARIEALRAIGVRVALDDFGTGHCSFNALRSLPVDVIKVDRSYIATLNVEPVSSVFVTAIAEIGRVLGLPIVAEGVETEEEFRLARAAGCNRFQGYFFGRPAALPAAERAVA